MLANVGPKNSGSLIFLGGGPEALERGRCLCPFCGLRDPCWRRKVARKSDSLHFMTASAITRYASSPRGTTNYPRCLGWLLPSKVPSLAPTWRVCGRWTCYMASTGVHTHPRSKRTQGEKNIPPSWSWAPMPGRCKVGNIRTRTTGKSD